MVVKRDLQIRAHHCYHHHHHHYNHYHHHHHHHHHHRHRHQSAAAQVAESFLRLFLSLAGLAIWSVESWPLFAGCIADRKSSVAPVTVYHEMG